MGRKYCICCYGIMFIWNSTIYRAKVAPLGGMNNSGILFRLPSVLRLGVYLPCRFSLKNIVMTAMIAMALAAAAKTKLTAYWG